MPPFINRNADDGGVILSARHPVYSASVVFLAVVIAGLLIYLALTLWNMGNAAKNWNFTPQATLTQAERDALYNGYDPFTGKSGADEADDNRPLVITALDLTLHGIRINEANETGSAIISGSDGVQQYYATGATIMDGVILKSVKFDHVVLDHNGVAEGLYISQSDDIEPVDIPEAGEMSGETGGINGDNAKSTPALSGAAVGNGIDFAPRQENGRVTGLAVTPKGDNKIFQLAGFQPGDIITEINGNAVSSAGDAARLAAQIKPGARLSIMVERGTQNLPIAIIIPEK